MLEKIDLKQKLKKDEYDKKMDQYGDLLGKLQRECREAKIPVIILVEGWRGAMRTDIINEMMQKMDSRGFKVFSASKMTEEQREELKEFSQEFADQASEFDHQEFKKEIGNLLDQADSFIDEAIKQLKEE